MQFEDVNRILEIKYLQNVITYNYQIHHGYYTILMADKRMFCRISPVVESIQLYFLLVGHIPGGLYNGIYANMISPTPRHPRKIRVP